MVNVGAELISGCTARPFIDAGDGESEGNGARGAPVESSRGLPGGRPPAGAGGGRCLPLPSPLVGLDGFIGSTRACRGAGGRGFCRGYRWVQAAVGGGRRVVYEVGGNRWCARLGRAHRSNHITVVADLDHQKYAYRAASASFIW